jgi:hypothetical protein
MTEEQVEHMEQAVKNIQLEINRLQADIAMLKLQAKIEGQFFK